MQTVFYLERELWQIVPTSSEIVPGVYYITAGQLMKEYSFRREFSALNHNPLNAVCDPFSGDDMKIFSGFNFSTQQELYLQNKKYYILGPIHPHP